MDNNALSAGVSIDGLKNKLDIKILICQLIASSTEKLNDDDIALIMYHNQLANYFEVRGAMGDLVKDGNLLRDDSGNLSVTEEGRNAAASIYHSLPYTVRKKAEEALDKVIIRKRHERENKVEIEPVEFGQKLTCHIMSGDEEIMTTSVTLPGGYEAKLAKERFLDDPEGLYRAVYSFLSGQHGI